MSCRRCWWRTVGFRVVLEAHKQVSNQRGSMEHLTFSTTDSSIHIDGYPDASGLIPLRSGKAKRLAHLSLHKEDLEFSLACLHSINDAPDENIVVGESLWRSAILHYFKCFGKSKSRFQLQSRAVYKREPPIAQEVFEYFKSLRDKHLVHDENTYTQSKPVAILNDGQKPYKIEKIVCLNTMAATLGQDNYSNLEMLITRALSWVVAEFDQLADGITTDLEQESFDELSRQVEKVSQSVPTADEIHLERE